jgi:hypothetical protein
MIMRGYKELTCVKFVGSDFTWGSTTSSYIMLDSGVSIPTNVSTTDIVSSSVTPDSPAATGTKTYTFLLPDVFDVVSAMDGTAYGSFRLYTNVNNTGASGSYAEITSVDITLEAVDSDDNTRELFSDTVWTGSCKSELGETDYLGIMYWFNLNKQELQYSERLQLTMDLDYAAYDPVPATPTGMSVGITCSPDDKDMTLTLPFIV